MAEGFLKLQPALDSRGCEARRLESDSSSLRSICSGVPGCPTNVAEIASLRERPAMPVTDIHFGRSFHLNLAVAVDEPHTTHLPESFAAHRALIHPQRAADVPRDSFKPLEPADLCVAG